MTNNGKLIHQERFLKLSIIIPSVLLVLVWVYFLLSSNENYVSILVYTILTILLLGILIFRRNSNYNVYEDRIELLNMLGTRVIEKIDLDQIFQVRYEDEFENSYALIKSKYILLYPNEKAKFMSQKDGRITLSITGFRYEAVITKLLNHFQSKNIEVVIKTTSKKIKATTGLRNWNENY